MTLSPRPALALLAAAALFLFAACGGGGSPSPEPSQAPEPSGTATATSTFDENGLVGRPQNRANIGDVQLAFDRYADKRQALIDLYKSQPWFKDGLTREESLFVERGITFVARYDGPRFAQVPQASIEGKLYKYDKVKLSQGEIELLLIYEKGDNADAEMTVIKQALPAIEELVGVQFPEKVLTIVNGDFEINDFNDGQFIRIARCCVNSAFVLAHELAHAYWSMAPSWFIEGMADLYANFALIDLNENPPQGWRQVPIDLDSYYRTRKSALDAGRYPNKLLPLRLASDGLYEVADVFLLDIRKTIGEQQFAAAAKDIYLASDFGRYILRDKRLEDIFLAHTAEADKAAVMAMFNKSIWGDNGERYQQLKDQDGS
jgi:hypothetical protein